MTSDWETLSHLSFMPQSPYPPLRGTFPWRGGYDTRISSSKRRRSTLVSPSAPPYRHPERSPRSLLHCRHRHACDLTQTTPWCSLYRLSFTHGLPACKKDPSTSAGMTREKDGSSHILFHTAMWSCASPRHSILRLRRGPSPRAYSYHRSDW